MGGREWQRTLGKSSQGEAARYPPYRFLATPSFTQKYPTKITKMVNDI